MPEKCFVITANDSIECVVVGTEADAVAKRDECQSEFESRNPYCGGGSRSIYWHWHEVPIFINLSLESPTPRTGPV